MTSENILSIVVPLIGGLTSIFFGLFLAKKKSFTVGGFTYDREQNKSMFLAGVLIYFIVGILLIIDCIYVFVKIVINKL